MVMVTVIIIVGLTIFAIDLYALSSDRARRQVSGPLDSKRVGPAVVVHIHPEADSNAIDLPRASDRCVIAVDDQAGDPGRVESEISGPVAVADVPLRAFITLEFNL